VVNFADTRTKIKSLLLIFNILLPSLIFHSLTTRAYTYFCTGGADNSLARPGTKQATATEDFEFHISLIFVWPCIMN